MTEQPVRLMMTGVSKSFGAINVLDEVDFSIARGEIVALLGSNGAGKSTLMKILTGVYSRDAGEVRVEGRPVALGSPQAAGAEGIVLLPQEISVFPDLSVAENICLSGRGRGLVSRKTQQARAAGILADLGFDIPPSARVGDLSVAERRIVEIARALASDAQVLVMDEPTAALSEPESAQIFKVLRRLKERGTSVVYISHYLNEVFDIADRIEVLRDGRNAGRFFPSSVKVEEVVAAMLGQTAGQLFEDRQPRPQGNLHFRAVGLSVPGSLQGVTFDLHRGEILGVFGLIGSGVETLGRVIFGATRRSAGQMLLDGADHAPASPAQAKACGIGFVTAERKTEGIFADLSVADNMTAPFRADHGTWALADQRSEARHAAGWIARLGIRTSGPDQAIRFLSGGNQQKVCIARGLTPHVRMLVLEEPTRGVDVGARAELYRQVSALAEEGLAVLVLSSDAEEIAGLSDRSFVIDRGQLVAEFKKGVTAGDLMAATALRRDRQVG